MAKREKPGRAAGGAKAAAARQAERMKPGGLVKTAAAPPATYPPIPSPTLTVSASNVAALWRPAGNGAGELFVSYQGPLASSEAMKARTGILRTGGQAWAELREVNLTREKPGRFVGVIEVPSGAPVEAVELAFHAGGDWDNGGRAPLGFYEWAASTQQVQAR